MKAIKAIKGTHGKEELSFENLSFSGQAKSLNGQIRVLEKAILAHFRKAEQENRNMAEIKKTNMNQLIRLLNRINDA